MRNLIQAMLTVLVWGEVSLAGLPEEQIRSMAGCYDVTFEFAETFLRKEGHPIRSAPYLERGLEYIEVDVDIDGEIHLQHILATPQGPLKHWRQEWYKAPKEKWSFAGRTDFSQVDSPLKWVKTEVSMPSDVWLQRVLQVDDSPRYECAARWVTTGQRTFWECESPAPLPRREFSKRSDYDILKRRNRHEIQLTGWVHEQDNFKLQSPIMALLAEEKGINTYRKVKDESCKRMKAWWGQNKAVWHIIQAEFRSIYSEQSEMVFQGIVEGSPLWMKLHKWAQQNASSPLDSKLKTEVRAIIQSHLVN